MKTTCFKTLFFLYLLWTGGSCVRREQTKKANPETPSGKKELPQPPTKHCETLSLFQTLTIAGHPVDIALPADTQKIHANLLILQGWDFPKDDWCNHSSLCRKALAQGYRLVMPEMGKSTYSSRLYPETRRDWRRYPTRKWLTDTLITALQEKYCILTPSQKNFVIGLSTGARGAGLAALNLPDLFRGAAALSGDFDQRGIPDDRIMTGFYGHIRQFPERWEGQDNMVTQIDRFKTPFYLGHGQQDHVCPPAQTRLFYDSLKAHHPRLKITLHMPVRAGHDYRYWDAEVDPVLKFFQELW